MFILKLVQSKRKAGIKMSDIRAAAEFADAPMIDDIADIVYKWGEYREDIYVFAEDRDTEAYFYCQKAAEEIIALLVADTRKEK